ncbi:MAG: helix-turn-helix transcriptional regulator [Oscillibacter sp.]|nr:helix-turn-helix transcriptional regulator [Oscillibacter sp.]
MARERFQTLTEQMFYILLSLRQECCGTDIMERVAQMTRGRVAIGPGTLYHLLESFLSAGMIRETRTERRRRSYILTPAGEAALAEEYRRLRTVAADYEAQMGGAAP